MNRVKVVIDRSGCIPDHVCIAICPEVFTVGDDGLAVVVEGLRIDNRSDAGVVDGGLVECAAKAAELCPRGVIKLERVEEASP